MLVLRLRHENKLSYWKATNHFKISNSAMLVIWQQNEKEILGLDNKQRAQPIKMKTACSLYNIGNKPLKNYTKPMYNYRTSK